MANNMEKAHLLQVQEMKNMENGRKGRELNGLEEANRCEDCFHEREKMIEFYLFNSKN